MFTEQLLRLPETVAALVDAVAQQRQDFGSLTTTVAGSLERTMALVREGFSAVRVELTELRADMDAGFTAVDARFDQVDAQIRAIKDRLAS